MSNHDELPHHAGILMFEDVAVIHVGLSCICEVSKLGNDTDRRAGIDQHSILEAPLMRQRRLAATVQDAKMDVVDMERVAKGVPFTISQISMLPKGTRTSIRSMSMERPLMPIVPLMRPRLIGPPIPMPIMPISSEKVRLRRTCA